MVEHICYWCGEPYVSFGNQHALPLFVVGDHINKELYGAGFKRHTKEECPKHDIYFGKMESFVARELEIVRLFLNSSRNDIFKKGSSFSADYGYYVEEGSDGKTFSIEKHSKFMKWYEKSKYINLFLIISFQLKPVT